MYHRLTIVGVTLVWILAQESLAQKCIRNEENVEEGRTCSPSCTTNNDCVIPGDTCICDDVCGWSCVNRDLQCGQLESPHFGYILGKERQYDDNVLYYCHSGYILSGPNHRRCRSDGKWNGITPKCLPFSTCGLGANPEDRVAVKKVVRGHKTTTSTWPWHVMLLQNKKNKINESFESLFGSATIINERWVITAAHLFALLSTDKPTVVDHSVLLVAGISELPKKDGLLQDGIQIFRPREIIRHRKFNSITNDYDICLIRLGARMIPGKYGRFVISPSLPSFRFTFNEYVRPVCLPCVNEWLDEAANVTNEVGSLKEKCETRGQDTIRQPAVVTGYGGMTSIDQNSNFFVKWSSVLRQGNLEILPVSICQEGVRRINIEYEDPEFTPNMICARGTNVENLQDACHGDSGGPLMQKVKSSSGYEYWILVGIVSWGWGCANADKEGFIFPGYYTNVTTFIPWISETMKNREDNWSDSRNSIFTVYLPIYAQHSSKMIQTTFWSLVVDIDSTVASIKQDIENNFPRYKQSMQQLFYNGTRMFSSRTLRSYGIRKLKRVIPVLVFLY